MSTIVAFYRLTTNGRVFRTLLTLEQAVAVIDSLLAYDHVIVLLPGERHLPIFTQRVLATRATRDLIPDAHLAALAVEHGGVVCTNDHDFDRFTNLGVQYPFATMCNEVSSRRRSTPRRFDQHEAGTRHAKSIQGSP